MATLTETDILDEHDALQCNYDPVVYRYRATCRACGAPLDRSTGFALDRADSCDVCADPDYDPSPLCNCGECTKGNYTCIRGD